MNHLQEAKNRITGENMIPAYDKPTERDVEEAKVHALIAIAEQLEKMNEPNDKALKTSYNKGFKDGRYGKEDK